MMSKPKYVVILTGLFCSVVAGGTSYFYSLFVNILARADFFGMTTLACGLASQAQARNQRVRTVSLVNHIIWLSYYTEILYCEDRYIMT